MSTSPSRSVSSNRIGALLLFSTVALAPLPLGSTAPVSIALLCIVLGVGVLTVRPPAFDALDWTLLACVGCVVAAYAVVIAAQLASPPLAGATAAVAWADVAGVLGIPAAPIVSAVRNEALYAVGAPLAALLSCTCAYLVCRDRLCSYKLLNVVAWSGSAYAAYGIVSFAVDPTHVLWIRKEAYQDVLTATFVNRNTAAVFFGTVSIVWMLLIGQTLQNHQPGGIHWRAVPHLISARPRSELFFPVLALLICVAAMFMTGSRAGILLSLAMMLIAFGTIAGRSRMTRRSIINTLVAFAAIALCLLQIVGSSVGKRLDEQGLADTGRLDTYSTTVRIIVDHPWLGTGLGTFASVYPAYRSGSSIYGVWDRAHSTPLEIAAEMGLPAAAVIGAAWALAFAAIAYGLRIRRRDQIILHAAWAAAALSLAHSAIDFSLQIPGHTVVVCALLGAGLAQARSTRGRTARPEAA